MEFFETLYNVFGDVATIYETEDGRARIFINEGFPDETRLQFFDRGEDAVDWLLRRGWTF